KFQIGGRELSPGSGAFAGGQRLSGTFQFATSGQGTLSDPVLKTTLDGRDVKLGDVEIGELHGSVDTSGQQGIWTARLDARNESFDAALRGNGRLSPFEVEHATAGLDRF